jgi:hypothetical protein
MRILRPAGFFCDLNLPHIDETPIIEIKTSKT